jgi:hypothetical protein
MRTVRTAAAASVIALHRSVLDVIYLVATVALFALVGLLATGLEKLR